MLSAVAKHPRIDITAAIAALINVARASERNAAWSRRYLPKVCERHLEKRSGDDEDGDKKSGACCEALTTVQ